MIELFSLVMLCFVITAAVGWCCDMFSEKGDIAVFMSIVLVVSVMACLAYWLPTAISFDDPEAARFWLFPLLILVVAYGLKAAVWYRDLKRRRENGHISDREWIRRVDALLARAARSQ